MCIKFVFKDVGDGCVYNFVTQAVPVAKNPIRKEKCSDTCLKILNFQFKSMTAQMFVLNSNKLSKYEAKLLKKPQSFYSYVRKHTSSKVAIPIIRNKDNVLCSNFSETANVFADFFASVYSSDSTVSLPNISSFKYKNLLTDISITKEMVRQQINNLSENVAPGVLVRIN
jgi:hypothetical protein